MTDDLIVVDGHSSDRTVSIANDYGARVITEHGRGKVDAVRVVLAHARHPIAAEMFDSEAQQFWSGSSSFQSKVISAFKDTGVKAIVAERVPTGVRPSGWYRVGRSTYYLYAFERHRGAV